MLEWEMGQHWGGNGNAAAHLASHYHSYFKGQTDGLKSGLLQRANTNEVKFS